MTTAAAPPRAVDAHHHLWNPATRDFPWMTGEAAALRRRYGLDDLRTAIAGTGVERTVAVQAVGAVDETRELLATAAGSGGLVTGVVGWVDLTAPDIADALGALRAGPGGDLLVGVRHQVHDEPDAGWLLRADVLAGLLAVADAGLAFDLLVRPRELPAAVEVARRLPGLRLVLDHAGKPGIAAGEWEPWAGLVTALARYPDVTCKLSGLVTEAAADWTPARLAPYADHVLGAFGPGRVLFGSDWPVCTLRSPYEDVHATALALVAGLSAPERRAVLHDNAVTVYGLDPGLDPATRPG